MPVAKKIKKKWIRNSDDRLRRAGNTAGVVSALVKEPRGPPRPKPKPKHQNGSCINSLGADGLRGAAFQRCLKNYLATTNGEKVTPYQQSVTEVARTLAHAPVTKLGGHRGMLVYHSTGSGKTITSLGIALAYFDTPRTICIITTPANKKDNNAEKYLAELQRGYYPAGPATILGTSRADADAQMQTQNGRAELRNRFISKVKFFTFWEFATRVGLAGGERSGGVFGSLLPAFRSGGLAVVLDEAHSLASPDKGESVSKSRALFKFFVENNVNKLHTFALTATPGTDTGQWAGILDIVRRTDQPQFSSITNDGPTLTSHIDSDNLKGMVSYVNAAGNRTKFARRTDEPVIVTEMDALYYAVVLHKLAGGILRKKGANLVAKQLNRSTEPRDFLGRIRAAGSYLLKGEYNPSSGKWMLPSGISHLENLCPKVAVNKQHPGVLTSPKLNKVVDNLISLPGKQYVYMTNAESPNSYAVLAALLKKRGMHDVTEKVLNGTFDASKPVQHAGKNFIVVATSDAANISRLRHAFNGLNPLNKRGLQFEAYTAETAARNLHGQQIKIVIATKSYYQGFDVKALRGVHIVDPLGTREAEMQAEGRGARLYGHAHLSDENKKVSIYKYMNVLPEGFSFGTFEAVVMPHLKNPAVTLPHLRSAFEWMQAHRGMPSTANQVVKNRQTSSETKKVLAIEAAVQNVAVNCEALRRMHPHAQCGRSTRLGQNSWAMRPPQVKVNARPLAAWKQVREYWASLVNSYK